MAEENKDGQEKTEQATPKRRQDARKKGDVARSKELTTSGVMLTASAALLVLGGPLGGRLADGFAAGFVIDRNRMFDPGYLSESLAGQVVSALFIMLPLGLVIACAAFGFSVMLGGATFSATAFAPKAERINPGKGLKRMFGIKAMVELAKSVAKVALIALIAVAWLTYVGPEVMRLADMPTSAGLVKATWLAAMTLLVVSTGLLVGTAIDVPWQLFDHAKKLRMTRQEVRDEQKETDGRPEVRQRIRQMQQEVATRRMMDSVPYADVIITNPTHYAVALSYQEGRMAAPKVVAKGQDLVAARIREIGDEHRVPLFSAPPLARSLFFSTKIDQEIPAGLYTAVAQVLAYIFQLRDLAPGAQRPEPPVPEVDEYRFTKRRVPAETDNDNDSDRESDA
ncbi:MAG: flagellar biosynthesis protein FlhB [Pseudomonadota bacterium]